MFSYVTKSVAFVCLLLLIRFAFHQLDDSLSVACFVLSAEPYTLTRKMVWRDMAAELIGEAVNWQHMLIGHLK